MQDFWNKRYQDNHSVYGSLPNLYFKEQIDALPAGTLLLPGEGEGRNAVYAAQKGWQVDAFDFSEVAQEKALAFAERFQVILNYQTISFENYQVQRQYDAIGLIYIHLLPEYRASFHQQIVDSIKPGGFVLLEAFSKRQLNYKSGGPQNEQMLYNPHDLLEDFSALEINQISEEVIHLEEGSFHQGEAAVIRLVACKRTIPSY